MFCHLLVVLRTKVVRVWFRVKVLEWWEGERDKGLKYICSG